MHIEHRVLPADCLRSTPIAPHLAPAAHAKAYPHTCHTAPTIHPTTAPSCRAPHPPVNSPGCRRTRGAAIFWIIGMWKQPAGWQASAECNAALHTRSHNPPTTTAEGVRQALCRQRGPAASPRKLATRALLVVASGCNKQCMLALFGGKPACAEWEFHHTRCLVSSDDVAGPRTADHPTLLAPPFRPSLFC